MNTKSILQEVVELKTLAESFTPEPFNPTEVLTNLFQSFADHFSAPPKLYIGCWAEEGNSEWAGMTNETYPTEQAAIDAARSSAWGCHRGVRAWACEAEALDAA